MGDEEVLEVSDSYTDGDQDQVQPHKSLAVGLTPFGHITINITNEQGELTTYPIDNPAEAWQFAGHINALANMMMQNSYANAMQERLAMAQMLQHGKKLVVPPGFGS